MANSLNATTPQLKVVDRFFAAYRTCDLSNAAPMFSKNYVYKPFPKTPGLSDQTREEHMALFGPAFVGLVKFEVRIQRRGTQFELPLLKPTTLAHLPRSD